MSDEDDVYSVSPAAFRAQMEYLRSSEATVLRLDAALDLLKEPVEGRYACITFDDGYRDVLEHAVPVLEQLELPATVFAVGDILDGNGEFYWCPPPRPAAMTWEDVAEMLARGWVDVQAHSRTHARLTELREPELAREIAGVKAHLEQRLPYPLTSYCYPAGLYTQREVDAVLDAGFRAGITTAAGVNRVETPPGELRRTMIYWRDGLEEFVAKLDGLLDRPSPLGARVWGPRAGRTRRDRVPTALRRTSG